MRDWEKLKTRYLRDAVPVRLGGVAANLARIKSFSVNQNQESFVEMMIDESKRFLEWTILDIVQENQSELVDLQIQLAVWQRNWPLLWSDMERRMAVANMAEKWSERLLELSGLPDER